MKYLDKIERILGYKFIDKGLLEKAITHTSFLNNKNDLSFERLEFLGDRVLGLVIADIIYEKYKDETEGDLAKRIAVLVSGKTLAEIAIRLKIPNQLKVAENLYFDSGDNYSILSDTMEAIIGAIFLDSNYSEAKNMIKLHWNKSIHLYTSPPKDPKSELQELAMELKYEMPIYSEYLKEGPDHSPKFKVKVNISNLGNSYGTGVSKKIAERNAAIKLLKIIERKNKIE